MVVLYFLPDWRKVTWAPRGATWCHVVPRGGATWSEIVNCVSDWRFHGNGFRFISSRQFSLLNTSHSKSRIHNISYFLISKQLDNIPKFCTVPVDQKDGRWKNLERKCHFYL